MLGVTLSPNGVSLAFQEHRGAVGPGKPRRQGPQEPARAPLEGSRPRGSHNSGDMRLRAGLQTELERPGGWADAHTATLGLPVARGNLGWWTPRRNHAVVTSQNRPRARSRRDVLGTPWDSCRPLPSSPFSGCGSLLPREPLCCLRSGPGRADMNRSVIRSLGQHN